MEIFRRRKKSNRVRAESNSEPLPLTLSLLVDLRHILDKVMDNHAYHYNLLLEKPKLETLHSPNKRSPKAIKSHEDSDSSKSKSSSKASFQGSPDLSSGIETILTAIDLTDNSRLLITSMNLCNIKNMIQLSNLDLEDVSNLFHAKTYVILLFRIPLLKSYVSGNVFNT